MQEIEGQRLKERVSPGFLSLKKVDALTIQISEENLCFHFGEKYLRTYNNTVLVSFNSHHLSCKLSPVRGDQKIYVCQLIAYQLMYYQLISTYDDRNVFVGGFSGM